MGYVSGSKILKCSCQHSYQDEKFGKYRRVHTFGLKRNGFGPGYKCTVCGALKKS